MPKKSNDPNKAREITWRNRLNGHLVHGRTLSVRAWDQYQKIMTSVMVAYYENGRKAAIELLQYHRPWLVDYCKKEDLPASGELLDALIHQRHRKKRNN